jgi:hypothetical protein
MYGLMCAPPPSIKHTKSSHDVPCILHIHICILTDARVTLWLFNAREKRRGADVAPVLFEKAIKALLLAHTGAQTQNIYNDYLTLILVVNCLKYTA